MALEKIGVQAVVDGIGNYLSDMGKLNKATSDAADTTEKAGKSSEAMSKALQGMGKIVAGLGLTSLFAGMIKSAGESEDAVAALDAVLKSTKNAIVGAGDAAGEATGNIKVWQDGLDKAQKVMDELQAKLAAGIAFTKEESKTFLDASQEAQKYAEAIDNANKSNTNLTDTTKKGVTVVHMSRQALLDLATSLQNVTRFSDETIISGESMLLTFTQIGKDIFPRATKAVLDYAQKFGNVEQAAVAIGKALQDPISGVTNLRRVGVMLNDTQKNMIEKFVKTGQVAKAQDIILKELETEFGGLAEAAGKTLPGKFDILRNKFDDVMEAAGGKLAPALGTVVDFAGKLIAQAGDLAPVLVIVAAGIGAITLAMGPLGAVLAVILSPIGLIIGAVAALGLAFSTNFLGIRDIVTNIWNSLQPIIADIVGFFQNLFAGVDPGAMLHDLGWRIQHAIEAMFMSIGIDPRIVSKIFEGLGNLVDWFTKTAIPDVLDFITNTVIPGIQDFIDTLVRIWTDVEPFVGDLLNWFTTEGLPAIQGAIDWFVQNVAQPFIDLLSGLWSSVEPALSTLKDWFVNSGLPAVKNILYDLWQNVFKPLVDLMAQAWTLVQPGLQGVADFFNTNGPKIGYIIGTVIGGAFSGLLTIIQSIVDWLGKAIQQLSQFLSMGGGEVRQSGIAPVLDNPGQYVAPQYLRMWNQTGLPTNIRGRDSGGPYSADQPYLVGVGAQPELFMPSSAGFAIPNFISALASAMPVSNPASYAYSNTYNNQQSQGDINFNGVNGIDDAQRRYAILRAMGRVR